MVAGLVDEGFGLFEMRAGLVAIASGEGEAGGGEVVVGEVKPQAGARRDAEDFVEIVGRAPGEEGEWKAVKVACASEEVDGVVEVVDGFGGAGGVGTAKRKVVEADGDETKLLLGDDQGLRAPAQDFRGLALTEEKIAVQIAPE